MDKDVLIKSPYSKLTKDILISKLEALEEKEKLTDQKLKNYESLASKYSVLKDARKEDKAALENANVIARTFQQREKDVTDAFTNEFKKMQKDVNEQSQTILTLFEMMDNSINQQIFYYKKFKSIFVDNLPQEDDLKIDE